MITASVMKELIDLKNVSIVYKTCFWIIDFLDEYVTILEKLDWFFKVRAQNSKQYVPVSYF